MRGSHAPQMAISRTIMRNSLERWEEFMEEVRVE
jgi:hypothetical protein